MKKKMQEAVLNLLAASSFGWILDVLFVLILLGGLALGIKRGLIQQILKIGGTLFAIAFALFFCGYFEEFLEGLTGLRTAGADKITAWFSDKELFNVDISALSSENLELAMDQAGVWGIVSNAILKSVGGETLPEGTTIAMLVGPIVSRWIFSAVSFVILFILIKLAIYLIGKLLTKLIRCIPVVGVVDTLLGGVFGLLKAGILLFLLFAIVSWLPWEGADNFIGSSFICGNIYNSAWFINATNYIISFEWFHAYLIR